MIELDNGDIQYSVMVSSSVNGFEDTLLTIEGMLNGWGYDVIMSMLGTLKVNPHLHNFDNCMKAVEECDLFLGIIRTDCGTGRVEDGCITFDEFKKARDIGKPCWFVIDQKVRHYRNLLKTLELMEHPETKDEDLNTFIAQYYDRKVRARERLPHVQQLFKAKDIHQFDPLCFAMEDFVNHKGYKKEQITNNWMQYCNDINEIKKFLDKNLGNKEFIDDIIKGVI